MGRNRTTIIFALRSRPHKRHIRNDRYNPNRR